MTTLPVKPGLNRTLAVAAGVVVFHGFALWALQSDRLRRAVLLVVPVEAISEVIVPPVPVPARPPVATAQPTRSAIPVARPVAASPPPAPQMTVPVNPEPASNAPSAIPVAATPLPAITQPVSPGPLAARAEPRPAAPAPSRLELPSSDADYLQNPKPDYPPMSKRLGEQGTVLVRVLIGVDGLAQQGEIQQSSHFDRLDRAALATALKWRYVAGKRAGKPEAMWFTVPIAFVLQ